MGNPENSHNLEIKNTSESMESWTFQWLLDTFGDLKKQFGDYIESDNSKTDSLTWRELETTIESWKETEIKISFIKSIAWKIYSKTWASVIELINENYWNNEDIISHLKNSRGSIWNKYLEKYIEETISRLEKWWKKSKFDMLLHTLAFRKDSPSISFHNQAQDNLIEEILNNWEKEYNEHYIKWHSSELSNYLLKVEDFEDYLRDSKTTISWEDLSSFSVVNSRALANYLLHCKDYWKKATGALSQKQIKDLLNIWENKEKDDKITREETIAYKILKENDPKLINEIKFSNIAYEVGIDDFSDQEELASKIVTMVEEKFEKLYAVTDSELLLLCLSKIGKEKSSNYLENINPKALSNEVINYLCSLPFLNVMDLILKIPEKYWENNDLSEEMIQLINDHNKKVYIYKILQTKGLPDSKLASIVLPSKDNNNLDSTFLNSSHQSISPLDELDNNNLVLKIKNYENSHFENASIDYSEYINLYNDSSSFKEAIKETLEYNPDDVIYFKFIFDSLEISKEIIDSIPETFKYFPERLRGNPEIILNVLNIVWKKEKLQYLLEYISITIESISSLSLDELDFTVSMIEKLYKKTNSIRYRDFLIQIKDVVSNSNLENKKQILRKLNKKIYIEQIEQIEKVKTWENNNILLDSQKILKSLESFNLSDKQKEKLSKFLDWKLKTEDLLDLVVVFPNRMKLEKIINIIVEKLETSRRVAKENVSEKTTLDEWKKVELVFGIKLWDEKINADKALERIYDKVYLELNSENTDIQEINNIIKKKIQEADISDELKKGLLACLVSKTEMQAKVIQRVILENPSGVITKKDLKKAELEQKKEWIKENFSKDLAETMINDLEEEAKKAEENFEDTKGNSNSSEKSKTYVFDSIIYNYNPETWVLNSNWENLQLSKQDKNVVEKNPEAMKNLLNFSLVLQKVWLTKLWEIKDKIFTSISNVEWQAFKLDWDYLNENEIMKFLNAILVSVWEEKQSEITWLDDMIARVQVLNQMQFMWWMKTENNLYGTTTIEEKFIKKFVPRWSFMWFLNLKFEKAIS